MELIIIGSGSSGNNYAITNGKETLIIECGLPFSLLEQKLNFNISTIKGAIVSHSHKDHAGYIEEYLERFVDVYVNKDTKENLKLQEATIYENLKTFKVGGFNIKPFNLVHNVDCSGFIIQHKDIGKLLFITDTMYVPYVFNNFDYIMLETNYDDKIFEQQVDNGEYSNPHSIKGHLSINTAVGFLKNCNLSNTKKIILIHISSTNGSKIEFKKRIFDLFKIPTFIAKKNKTITL